MTPPPPQQLPPWVEPETTRTRKRATPKNMPQRKPAEPKPFKFRVNVVLSGSIDFELGGQDAIDLSKLLGSNPTADEVIEHLDPWSSGAGVRQEIEIIEIPGRWGGLHVRADETTGGIDHLGGRP